MPCMQRLSIWGIKVKGRDLVAEKPPLLRDIDVLEPRESYPMEVNNVVLQRVYCEQ